MISWLIRSPESVAARCALRRIAVSGALVDLHVEERREAHRAQHPQRVLAEALVRLADGPQDARLEIALTPEEVHELAGRAVLPGSPGHRVHREVAARQVLPERVGERDVIGAAMVGVAGFDAVGRDLDLVVARSDDHRAEAIGVERLREELLDLLRCRVRRDIPVLRIDAADRVAHAAADDVRRVPGLLERGDDLLDVRWDLQFGDGHGVSV